MPAFRNRKRPQLENSRMFSNYAPRSHSQDYFTERLSDAYAVATASAKNAPMHPHGGAILENRSLSTRSASVWDVQRRASSSQPSLTPGSQGPSVWEMSRPPLPVGHHNPRQLSQSATTISSAGELRVLGSSSLSSTGVDSKRLRNSITAPNPLLRGGSQTSDDMTLRHFSQASDGVRNLSQTSDPQNLVLLRESERVSRLESKMDELTKLQKSTLEELLKAQKATSDHMHEMTTMVRSIHKTCKANEQQNTSRSRGYSSANVAPSSRHVSPPIPSAPPKQSLNTYNSDDEDDCLFSFNETPTTAKELFAKAMKAREARRQLFRQPTTDDINESEPVSRYPFRSSAARLARSASSITTEVLTYTWNGNRVEPNDDDEYAAILREAVDFLARKLKWPKTKFAGFVLSCRRANKRFNRRFIAPSGKVCNRLGPKMVKMFQEG